MEPNKRNFLGQQAKELVLFKADCSLKSYPIGLLEDKFEHTSRTFRHGAFLPEGT